MYPYLILHFQVFDITIPMYTVFASVGFLFMMLFIYFRMDDLPIGTIDFTVFIRLILFITISAVLSSKILFFMTQVPSLLKNFDVKSFLYAFATSGFVFYGGLFGAIFGIILFSKQYKIPFKPVSNIVVPSFPLFHFFGRIGCFFGGCCYGIPADWGIPMQENPEIRRVPVQLFEALFELLIFIILMWIEKRFGKKAFLLKIYFVLYASGRLFLECLRGDLIRGVWYGFSTAQWISIGILVYIVVISAHHRFSHR